MAKIASQEENPFRGMVFHLENVDGDRFFATYKCWPSEHGLDDLRKEMKHYVESRGGSCLNQGEYSFGRIEVCVFAGINRWETHVSISGPRTQKRNFFGLIRPEYVSALYPSA